MSSANNVWDSPSSKTSASDSELSSEPILASVRNGEGLIEDQNVEKCWILLLLVSTVYLCNTALCLTPRSRNKADTFYDEWCPLRRFLPRANPVLVDRVLNFLELLQRIQIRRLPLLLQLLAAYVRICGKTPGCLCDLGLNGKLPLKSL